VESTGRQFSPADLCYLPLSPEPPAVLAAAFFDSLIVYGISASRLVDLLDVKWIS
jgi:hypothetical protein